MDYYQGEITYVSRDRMKYVGYNKYLNNIIYCSLAPDNYLYFKSSNPQYLYLEKVRITALFENAEETFGLQCDENGRICELLDAEFPLEASLVPILISLVVQELSKPREIDEDKTNDANDNLGGAANG